MTTLPPEGRGTPDRRRNDKNTDDAEKLELLLETFRRVDGEKWMLREVEKATGRAVSASYLSSIRGRRISRVGSRQREAMARVMGFPVGLWDAEPERWPAILADKRNDAEGNRGTVAPLADLLENLFRRGLHPLTGSPFTERSVAELSGGALTEDEVLDIRHGRLADPPEAKLLALSDVFGVPRSYWYSPASVPPLDENTIKFLSGPKRLRTLHMQLINLPEQERDEIGAVLERLVERAREQLTDKGGTMSTKKVGIRRPDKPPARGEAERPFAPRAWRLLLKFVGRMSPETGQEPPLEGGGLTSTRLFSEELKVLGLYGRSFTWEEYRDRLQAHLEIEIHVVFVGDDSDPVLGMLLDQAGTPGLVLRDEETGDALVLISAALDELAATAVVWHELAHIAGGHPVPAAKLPSHEQMDDGSQEDQHFWDPPRSVLGPPAPRDEELCERDARLRAELAFQAGFSGREPNRADESFFLLDGR